MSLVQKLKKANIRLYPQKLFYGPEWLVLGVNNICNLHCKMCDVGVSYNESNFFENLMGSKPLNMPLELITEVIEQAALYFPNTKLGYAFTEPLIYPHLIESLALAEQHNLYTSITTNALTLKRHAVALCKAGLNDIFISLDGPEAIHNEIRGHKSSFQRAIQGIELLLEQETRPEISVFCVITEWNIGHLEAFLHYFKDYPLKQIGFMHTNFTSDELAEDHNRIFGADYPATASNMEEIHLENMDLDLLWEEIEAIKSLDYAFPISFSPELSTKAEMKTFYHHPEIKFGKRCGDAFRTVMIKSNGSVIPAHGRCYNLTLGNLHESNLKTIWNSSVASKFRTTLMKEGGLLPACSRCCSAF